ncbi:MAG: YkgJ family cysteine cluster protein [Hyphomicrobiaceae bacterium]
MAKSRTSTQTYDCLKCPGYCCSYPVIVVNRRDLKRLAKRYAISVEEAERRFTKSAHGHDRVMRRKPDQHFGRICRFFDTDNRCCSVYEDRPDICRKFPSEPHCGYYDFLNFERRHQDDPDYIATTDSGQWE